MGDLDKLLAECAALENRRSQPRDFKMVSMDNFDCAAALPRLTAALRAVVDVAQKALVYRGNPTHDRRNAVGNREVGLAILAAGERAAKEEAGDE